MTINTFKFSLLLEAQGHLSEALLVKGYLLERNRYLFKLLKKRGRLLLGCKMYWALVLPSLVGNIRSYKAWGQDEGSELGRCILPSPPTVVQCSLISAHSGYLLPINWAGLWLQIHLSCINTSPVTLTQSLEQKILFYLRTASELLTWVIVPSLVWCAKASRMRLPLSKGCGWVRQGTQVRRADLWALVSKRAYIPSEENTQTQAAVVMLESQLSVTRES